MQKDVVLRLSKCNLREIEDCPDQLSTHKVADWNEMEKEFSFKKIVDGETERFQHICEVAVPGACPRIQCKQESAGEFRPCRMLSLVQSQENESGFWMKLPCSQCEEVRQLHPVTEGMVYSEDEGS